MKLRRFVRWILWVLVVPALVVFALRAFVGNVYYVDSRSMEPSIHGAAAGGDYVLVLFDDAPELQRFDVVVVRRARERDPLVKRVVGLPGEAVQIAGGDLFIDGRRLPSDAPRPPWIPIFDGARHDFDEHFHFDRNRWTASVDGRRVDGRGAKNTFAKLRMRGMDDYLAPDGSRVEGKRYVNDLAIEVEFRWRTEGGQWSLQVTEEGDVFSAEIAPKGGGAATLSLQRSARSPDGIGTSEKLAVVEVNIGRDSWHRMRLANRDNELRGAFDAPRTVLTHVYASNTPSLRPAEGGYAHVLPRVEIGGSDLDLDLRAVRVERDATYFELGSYGTIEPVTLGPDEIFLLGDNSSESVDSREWGPSSLYSIVGRPRAVVWPLRRWAGREFAARPQR